MTVGLFNLVSCSNSISKDDAKIKIEKYLNEYILKDVEIINLEKVLPPQSKVEGEYFEATCTFKKEHPQLGLLTYKMIRTYKFGEENEISSSIFKSLKFIFMSQEKDYYKDPLSPNFY